jgi:hypothetical protein
VDWYGFIFNFVATKEVIDVVGRHFESTLKYLASGLDSENAGGHRGYEDMSSSKYDTSKAGVSDLRDQLLKLGEYVVQCGSQRIAYLRASGGSSDEVGRICAKLEKHQSVIVDPFSRLVGETRAFYMAEVNLAFQSLVGLMFRYISDRRDLNEKIRGYVGIFGQAFADVLFDWYCEEKMWGRMFNEDEAVEGCDEFLDAFLRGRQGMEAVSWIQDLKMERFEDASVCVAKSVKAEKKASKRKTAASLAILFAASSETYHKESAFVFGMWGVGFMV